MLDISTISQLPNEVKLLILVWFTIWFLVWVLTSFWFRSRTISRTDVAAVIFASVWILLIVTGAEVGNLFWLIGAMAATHLIGEKAAKASIDLILSLKKWLK